MLSKFLLYLSTSNVTVYALNHPPLSPTFHSLPILPKATHFATLHFPFPGLTFSYKYSSSWLFLNEKLTFNVFLFFYPHHKIFLYSRKREIHWSKYFLPNETLIAMNFIEVKHSKQSISSRSLNQLRSLILEFSQNFNFSEDFHSKCLTSCFFFLNPKEMFW